MRSFLKSFRLATEVMVESLALIGYPDPPVIHFWASWQVSFFFLVLFQSFFASLASSAYFSTVFENHRKSLIQHSEHSLHFEWTKINQKCQKRSILASFWKSETCGQTVLPDMSVLIGQKLVENAKIQMRHFWVIFKQCGSLLTEYSWNSEYWLS